MKLYYNIGEVADILGESTSLVRFWTDKFQAFVKPERNAKGNRRYSPQDLRNLKTIHYLVKDRKMTLEGAAAMMKGNREGQDNRAEVVERLKSLKAVLLDISNSISDESR